MSEKISSMADLRVAIDELDDRLVPLLLDRLAFIDRAAVLKADRDTVRDDWRVNDVVVKARARAEKLGGDADYIETIYRFLIETSIAHEFKEWDKLADQGDK